MIINSYINEGRLIVSAESPGLHAWNVSCMGDCSSRSGLLQIWHNHS